MTESSPTSSVKSSDGSFSPQGSIELPNLKKQRTQDSVNDTNYDLKRDEMLVKCKKAIENLHYEIEKYKTCNNDLCNQIS